MFFFFFLSFFFFFSFSFWFTLWMILELNSMLFLTLMLLKKNLFMIEGVVIYYFIQTFSSIFMLFNFFLMQTWLESSMSMLNTSLIMVMFIKMGMVPFHSWYMMMSFSLSYLILLILLTLQKIFPFFFLLFMNFSIDIFSFTSLILSIVLSTLINYQTSMINLVLILSGISHSSWMLLAMNFSLNLWEKYFIVYLLITFFTVTMLNYYLMFVAQLLKYNYYFELMLFVLMMFYASFPPSYLFFIKIDILNYLVLFMFNLSIIILTLMMIFDFYVYLRLVYMFMLQKNKM